MIIYYIYLVLLLLIFILLYYGIDYSIKFAPVKIKVLTLTAFTAISLRYVSLIILLIAKNIKHLYLLKPFAFLNLLCIPILALVSLYILSRNDKFRLNYCIILSSLLLMFYIFIAAMMPANITYIGSLGYIAALHSRDLVYGIYLAINTIILFGAIILMGSSNINKVGMTLVIISATVQIVELLTRAMGINLLPAILIGDLFWLITGLYSLLKLKRN